MTDEKFKEFLELDVVKRNSVGSHIEVSWCIGGQSGGSCWDTDEHSYYAVNAEPEPEFVALDEILEELCPNIKFLQYKRLCQELVCTREERGSSDYYGNFTNYANKSIDLRALAQYLIDHDLWKETE